LLTSEAVKQIFETGNRLCPDTETMWVQRSSHPRIIRAERVLLSPGLGEHVHGRQMLYMR